MKRLMLETMLSFVTGALLLYAAMTSLRSFGETRPAGTETMPVAASRQAAVVRCNTCFALARRE